MNDFNDISYFKWCSNKLFWVKEAWQHPRLNRLWKIANRIECAPREELQKVVDDKLRAILKHAAFNVPYYKRFFSGKAVRVDSLGIEDFPIIEKSDIRGHENDFIAAGYAPRELEWTRTSGSTGEPFRFGRSSGGWDYSYAILWRGLARFGIRPGDRRVLVKGVDEVPMVSLGIKFKRSLYGLVNRCIVIDAHFLARSEDNVESELRRIVAYKPAYIHGYASSIYLLSQQALRFGISLGVLKVKAVVTESEKCYLFQRELIERVFCAPVVENYGCVEFGMIAQPAKDGVLCINEDHVYVEAMEHGEAVYTNLDEYGFPLIRFKNGDALKLGKAHSLLPYRTVDSLDGRIAESIRLPQGGCLQGYIVMYPISKHISHMKSYQVYQPDIDHLKIRIVPTTAEVPVLIVQQIVSEMREIVGPLMKIAVENVREIPLTKRGKRAFVVSDVE